MFNTKCFRAGLFILMVGLLISLHPGMAVANPKPNNSVQVILNGNVLDFEVPPIIENGRTLVPLRAIFEALGASVSWDQTSRTVTARQGATTVLLPLDSTHALVNNNLTPLDVPAKIINGRTLAPLRFVGEAFGSHVVWNNATQTINIDAVRQAPVTIITVEEKTNLREGPSTDAAKVDIAGMGERMTVLMEKDGWYQVSRGGRNLWVASWVVQVEPEAKISEPGNAIQIKTTRDAAGLRIILASFEKLEPEIREENGRVTFLCNNRQVTGINLMEENLGSKTLSVKAANFEKDSLITILLPSEVEYEILTEAGGCRKVLFIPNYITNIEKVPFGSIGEQVIVSTLCPVIKEERHLDNILEITLKNIKAGRLTTYSCSSELINSLHLRNCNGNNDVAISIETANLGKYILANSNNSELNIILVKSSAFHPRERIVMLDPGHGGSEPGTSGQQLVERDINLEIALKVGEILRQRGIQVKYTRTDDSYVDLETRAAIANGFNAALFVSIHHNGDTSPDPSGSETYFYAPLDEPELFIQKDERSRLAEIIQNELINHLHLKNRGVKEKNFLVLRNTQMPSALAEVAFLTNPAEEQLLQQDDFKNTEAQAIADGIESYLQNYYR